MKDSTNHPPDAPAVESEPASACRHGCTEFRVHVDCPAAHPHLKGKGPASSVMADAPAVEGGWCSQCGQTIDKPACGPTHALRYHETTARPAEEPTCAYPGCSNPRIHEWHQWDRYSQVTLTAHAFVPPLPDGEYEEIARFDMAEEPTVGGEGLGSVPRCEARSRTTGMQCICCPGHRIPHEFEEPKREQRCDGIVKLPKEPNRNCRASTAPQPAVERCRINCRNPQGYAVYWPCNRPLPCTLPIDSGGCHPVQQPAASELEEMRARKDAAYEERNRVVAVLARLALAHGWRAGTARTAIEGWSDDWHGCVYIDFPNGQASWHFHDSQAHLFADLPPYAGAWDGHTTEQKYERLHQWRAAQSDARSLSDEECKRIAQTAIRFANHRRATLTHSHVGALASEIAAELRAMREGK